MRAVKRPASCDRWFDRVPRRLMTIMMCGDPSQVETEATRRVRNPNHFCNRRDPLLDEYLPEDQPIVGMQSSVFQDHQYDLLAGRPPSRNPDYVPRSQHPSTTAPSQARPNASYHHYNSNMRSCPFSVFEDNQYNLLAGGQRPRNSDFGTRTARTAPPPFSAASLGLNTTNRHRVGNERRNSGSQTGFSTPFGERHYDLLAGTPPSHNPEFVPPSTAAPTPPVSCRASEEFVPDTSVTSSLQVPLANAVTVSDDGDDSGIPMVAALRISDEGENIESNHLNVPDIPAVTGLEPEEVASARPVSYQPVEVDAGASRAHPAANSTAVGEGADEEQPSRSWFPRARASPRSDVREAASRIPREEPRRNSNQGLSSFYRRSLAQKSCGTNHCSSWSRTRRSLTKPLGGRACVPSRGKENDLHELELRMAQSAEELAREQKALSKRIARSSRNLNQDEAVRATKPRSRRW